MDFEAAVVAFDTTDLPLVIEPAASALVSAATDAAGLVLLGEIHGVEQNPLIVASIMRTFGLRVLGLEWPIALQAAVDSFLEGGRLATGQFAWSNDGRITAGHFAVMRSLRREHLLERVALFDPVGFHSWDDRDRRMAENLLAGLGPGPALVVAGNLHTSLRPHQHGTPMGIHVAAARPSTLEIRLRYLSGEFLNVTRQLIRSPAPPPWQATGCELRVSGDHLELTVPIARAAVVPGGSGPVAAKNIAGPPPSGVETLAAHRAAGFDIRVVPATPGPVLRPSLTPLEGGDLVPWLPPGLTAGRLSHGLGLGAADAEGEVVIAWREADPTIVVGWREDDGPLPTPQLIETAGGTAVLWPGHAGWALVAICRPDGTRWTLIGARPREDLLRIAESLPGQ